MKYKIAWIGTGLLSLMALLLRVAEYHTTLDEAGYYLITETAVLLKWGLIGVLAVGVLWILAFGFLHRTRCHQGELLGNSVYLRCLFALAGVCVGWMGVEELMRAQTNVKTGLAVVTLLAAVCFLWAARSPKRTALAAVVPPVWLCVTVVEYFWATYKYIHISANILGMLGRCALLLLVFFVCKVLTDAPCSKRGLWLGCALGVLMLPTCFLAPMLAAPSLEALPMAALTLILLLIAFFMLKRLPREPREVPTVAEPDLSVLDQLLADVPEPEEDEE